MAKMMIEILQSREETRSVEQPEGWKYSKHQPAEKTVLVVEYRAEQPGYNPVEGRVEVDVHFGLANERGIADEIKRDVEAKRKRAAQTAYVSSLVGKKLEVDA